MGFWYVQKWLVKQGKGEEHEKLLMEYFKKCKAVWPDDMKRVKYFSKWYGPGNGRITIITGFESLEQFEKEIKKWNSDEKANELNKEWNKTVAANTWTAEFWGDMPLEKKKE